VLGEATVRKWTVPSPALQECLDLMAEQQQDEFGKGIVPTLPPRSSTDTRSLACLAGSLNLSLSPHPSRGSHRQLGPCPGGV